MSLLLLLAGAGLAASPVNVTTGSGAVTATGFAPSVTVSNNQTVASGVGSVTATGFAPVPSIGVRIATGQGSVTASGVAPTAGVSDNKSVLPGVGQAIVTGFAPLATPSDNRTVLPGVGAIIATGQAPQVSIGATVQSQTGSVDAIGYAPSVVALNPQTVLHGVGQLAVTGYAPSVDVAVVVTQPDVQPVISYGPASSYRRRSTETGHHGGIAGRQTEEWRARMLRLLDDALEQPDAKGLPKKKASRRAEPESPLTAQRLAVDGLAELMAPRPEPVTEPPAPRQTPKRTAPRRIQPATIRVIPRPEPVRIGATPVVAGVRFGAVRLGNVGAVAGARPMVEGTRSHATVTPVVTAHAIENPSDEELLMLLGM